MDKWNRGYSRNGDQAARCIKCLALLSIAFFLTSPGLSADLDYPRYGRPKVYTKRTLPVVECRYYQPIPGALYDGANIGQFNSNVWRHLPKQCAHTHLRPQLYPHHYWRGGISGR